MARFGMLGATGSVGLIAMKTLLQGRGGGAQPSTIVVVGRRQVPSWNDQVNILQTVVTMPENDNVESLDAFREKVTKALEGSDAALITFGAGAPSKVSSDALRLLDVTIPTEFAKAAKTAGVKHMALLTSVGADSTAKPSRWTGTAAGGGLYVQCKGRVEDNVRAVGFESFSVFRPSTLVGSPNTPKIASVLTGFVDWALPDRFKRIHIDKLGRAMAFDAFEKLDSLENGPFDSVFEGKSLFELVARSEAALKAKQESGEEPRSEL